jgi:hypothetical protein
MLCLLLVGRKNEKKKKRERETATGLFSQDWICFAGCAMWDFCSC